jgi:hypothetical protein
MNFLSLQIKYIYYANNKTTDKSNLHIMLYNNLDYKYTESGQLTGLSK